MGGAGTPTQAPGLGAAGARAPGSPHPTRPAANGAGIFPAPQDTLHWRSTSNVCFHLENGPVQFLIFLLFF